MSPGKDFIPYSLSVVADWMGNFAARLPGFAMKLTQTPANLNAKLQKKQLTAFVGEVVSRSTAQKSVYIQTDGELLCIVAPDESGLSPKTASLELTLRTAPNYTLEI